MRISDWSSDVCSSDLRSISHVLGQHPKAVLRDSHKFHLDYLVSGAATEPPLHSHDYSEIFMVLQGGYRFFWGNHAEHHVDLGPLDMFSVPPQVMRKFHSNREQPGLLLAIFDTTLRDPDDGIVISKALVDEAGGEIGRARRRERVCRSG